MIVKIALVLATIAGIMIGLLFLIPFFLIIFGLLYLISYPIVYIFKKNELDMLKKTDVTNFDRFDLNLNFEFNCEYCNGIINCNDDTCPNCHGDFHNNKKYLEIKKNKYNEYLDYLKKQEQELITEIELFKKHSDLASKNSNWFFNTSFYNQPIDHKHMHYIKRKEFDFVCEYCGTKLTGSLNDGKTCTNCGAEHDNNFELLALEEKEEVLKKNSDLYRMIQELKIQSNKNNYEQDNLFRRNFSGFINIFGKYYKYYFITIGVLLGSTIVLVIVNGIIKVIEGKV